MGRLVEGADERAAVNRALIELSLERGFQGLTNEDVAERAGLDLVGLERDHGGTEEILLRAFADELARFHGRVDRYMESDYPWADRVRATAYELMRFLREDLDVTRFLVYEVRAGGEQAMLMFGNELSGLIDLVDEGRQEMDDPDSLNRSTAEQIAGGLFNHLYGMVSRGPLPDEADLIPQLMYSTVLPYLGEERANSELRIPPPVEGGDPRPPDGRQGYSPPVRGKGTSQDAAGGDGAPLGPLPGGHHGLSPEQVAESQRERLLAAAADVVAERGYKETTITEIARRASVANRAFYANFETKEECIWAAIEAVLDHVRELITMAMATRPEWPEQIVAGIRDLLEFLAAEPELARLCVVVPLASTPGIASRYSEFVKFALPLLATGRAERPENDSLPAATEDQILGGLVSLLGRAVNNGDKPLAGLLPDLAQFALGPYLGEERAAEVIDSMLESPSA